MNRRRYLGATAAALSAGVAGCLSDSMGSNGSEERPSGYRPDEDVTEADLEETDASAEISQGETYRIEDATIPESFRYRAEYEGDYRAATGAVSFKTSLNQETERGRFVVEGEGETLDGYVDGEEAWINMDGDIERIEEEFEPTPEFLLGRELRRRMRELGFSVVEGGTVPGAYLDDDRDRVRAFRYDLVEIGAMNFDRIGDASGELILDEFGIVRELRAEYEGGEYADEDDAEDDDGMRTPTPSHRASVDGSGSMSVVMSEVGDVTVERPAWVDEA